VSPVHPLILCLQSAHQTGDLVLGSSLLLGNRLGVGVQLDAAGRTPEQFLNNLDVSVARARERCAGVAERVPPDFLRDATPRATLRIWWRMSDCPLYGFGPLLWGLAKTQSPAVSYFV
jgi:hypothetical protein